MKLGVEKDYPLIPAGEHILKLQSVEEVQFDDKFGKSTTGKVTRIKWRFVSNETNEDGVPYDYVVYTGLDYGNEKAALTLLVDMIAPGMTKDRFADFDTDDVIGKRFRCQIKHTKKDNGEPKPVHVYLTPIQAKAGGAAKAPPKPVTAEELEDPFAEDGADEYDAAA